MNAYYQSLFNEIQKQINEERYEQAYELIRQELDLPYVPNDAYQVLEAYSKACLPYLEKGNKAIDIDQLIHGSLESKIMAVSMLKKVNLRQYGQSVQCLFDSDLPDEYKGELIECLMEQKIDEPFEIVKSGLQITFIPSAILPMTMDPVIQEVTSLFDAWFGSEDVASLRFCMTLFMQMILCERPFDQSENDAYEIAKAIVRLVFEAMMRLDEWPLFIKKQGLENVMDIKLSIEK